MALTPREYQIRRLLLEHLDNASDERRLRYDPSQIVDAMEKENGVKVKAKHNVRAKVESERKDLEMAGRLRPVRHMNDEEIRKLSMSSGLINNPKMAHADLAAILGVEEKELREHERYLMKRELHIPQKRRE